MDKLKSTYIKRNGKYYDIVAVDENGEHLVIASYPESRWNFLQRYFVVEDEQRSVCPECGGPFPYHAFNCGNALRAPLPNFGMIGKETE